MSLQECRKLGKYSESNVSPRPLLITLSRSSEVSAFLDKQYALAKDNKPDLSLEERKVESIFLKERGFLSEEYNVKYNLIQLRGNKLFTDSNYMAMSLMAPLPAISYWMTSSLNQQNLMLLLILILHRILLIMPQSPQM